MTTAISPDQLILTTLSDLAVAAVEAWKANDDDAMSAALTDAHRQIVAQLFGADRQGDERAVESLIAKGWAIRLPDGGWALTELGRDAADDLKTRMKEQS